MSFKENKRFNGEIKSNNEKIEEKIQIKINETSNKLIEISTKTQFFIEKVEIHLNQLDIHTKNNSMTYEDEKFLDNLSNEQSTNIDTLRKNIKLRIY